MVTSEKQEMSGEQTRAPPMLLPAEPPKRGPTLCPFWRAAVLGTHRCQVACQASPRVAKKGAARGFLSPRARHPGLAAHKHAFPPQAQPPPQTLLPKEQSSGQMRS